MLRTMGEYQHMTDTSANQPTTPGRRRFAVPDIYRRYCSRRTLLRFRVESLFDLLRIYDRYRDIDYSRVNRMVFVCHGNICRSPFAEAVADRHGIAANSVGLAATGRSAATDGAIRMAKELGYEMADHVSRHAASEHVGEADLVVCMEAPQARAVAKLYGRASPQVTLLGLFADRAHPSILDPYGNPDEFFRDCFERIESAVGSLADRIGSSRASA